MAPEAVKTTELPIQVVALGGTILTTGNGFTTKLTVLIGPGQPPIDPTT